MFLNGAVTASRAAVANCRIGASQHAGIVRDIASYITHGAPRLIKVPSVHTRKFAQRGRGKHAKPILLNNPRDKHFRAPVCPAFHVGPAFLIELPANCSSRILFQQRFLCRSAGRSSVSIHLYSTYPSRSDRFYIDLPVVCTSISVRIHLALVCRARLPGGDIRGECYAATTVRLGRAGALILTLIRALIYIAISGYAFACIKLYERLSMTRYTHELRRIDTGRCRYCPCARARLRDQTHAVICTRRIRIGQKPPKCERANYALADTPVTMNGGPDYFSH